MPPPIAPADAAKPPPRHARPQSMRPEDRLLATGVHSLDDADLLSVLLSNQDSNHDLRPHLAGLLARFKGLDGLLSAARGKVAQAGSLGKDAWARLQAAQELVRRGLAEELRQRDALTSPQAVGHYLALNLQHRRNEVFCVLFLDSHNQLLAAEDVFQGTLNQTAVYPREVVRRAIEHNAAAVILAHNHPSGIPDPSAADRLLTEALTSALKCLDIRVLDHVIVAGGRQFSFAEHGLI